MTCRTIPGLHNVPVRAIKQCSKLILSMDTGEGASQGLRPYTRLTKASVEALRYRGEDLEKSLTKNTIKEVSLALSNVCLLGCVHLHL